MTGNGSEGVVPIKITAITLKRSQIRPNTWNPNVQGEFMQGKTRGSLDRHGLIEHILVRQVGPDNLEGWGQADQAGYEIVNGEHRWLVADHPEQEFACNDLGVIADAVARELTVLTNETKGEPEETRMAALMADIEADLGRDRLIEAMPYTKTQVDALLESRHIDWDDLRAQQDEYDDKRRRHNPRAGPLKPDGWLRLVIGDLDGWISPETCAALLECLGEPDDHNVLDERLRAILEAP